MVEAMRRHLGIGLVALLVSSAAFGTSGPFAKSLMEAGWTPGLVVLLRISGAALVLLPFTLWSLRGRWAQVRRELPLAIAYGIFAVAGAQLGYFQAVERLAVGVALLIEYLGIVLVVLAVWALTRRRPSGFVLAGVVLALAGLVLVLDVAGTARLDLVGLAWGLLAATGLASHYVLAARETSLPPASFAGLGLLVGAVVLSVLGLLDVIPMRAGSGEVVLANVAVPAWAPVLELVLVAAVLAYILGIVGARHLGSTLASFIGLTEVLFAILFAWLLLGELPRPIQLVGAVVLLAGVAAVRVGEQRTARSAAPEAETVLEPDFTAHSPVA